MKKGYAPNAERLLSLLDEHPKTTKALITLRYGMRPPRTARQAINDGMRKLQKAVAYNGEPFRIVNTKRAGPIDISYCIKK